MTLMQVGLDDKYQVEAKRIYLSGIQALVRLPEHYRQAVAWRHQEQLSWDEIGQRMSCTADAARKVWSRAIQQLRRELGELGSMP